MPAVKRKNTSSKVKRPAAAANKRKNTNKAPSSGLNRWLIKWWPAIVFVILIGGIGTYFLLQSRAATSTELLRMTFSKSSLTTNLCMDDYQRTTNNYGAIVQWSCNASDPAQQWQRVPISGTNAFLIKNPNFNICVDDTGDGFGTGPSDRVYVITWTCNQNDKAQQWEWYGSSYSQIKNANNPGCINAPGSNTNQGSEYIVYPCTWGGKTYFSVQPADTGGSGGGGSSCPDYAASTPDQAKNEAKCLMAGAPWYWSPSTYWNSLEALWTGESGWSYNAYNSASGACGIPQALPCGKATCNTAATTAATFRSSTTRQIIWGLNYIKCGSANFHNPNQAYSFWLNQSPHWYIESRDPTSGAVTRN